MNDSSGDKQRLDVTVNKQDYVNREYKAVIASVTADEQRDEWRDRRAPGGVAHRGP